MAKNRIEAEFVALNSTRIKFMMLTAEEPRKCRDDVFGTCTSLSSICVTANHRLCTLELFKYDKKD